MLRIRRIRSLAIMRAQRKLVKNKSRLVYTVKAK